MTANVIPLRPRMPEPPPRAARHHSSLEVWFVQERIIPTAANDDHWRWLSTVAHQQARELLDDYEQAMDGLIAAATEAGHLHPAGFLVGARSREAARVALLAALTEEVAQRTATESADVMAGEVEQV